MKPIRRNNPGLRSLLQFWQKHCVLEDWHIQWARANIKVIVNPSNGKTLSSDGEKQQNIYFVARGLLARVRYTENDKRQIINIAEPGKALLTTNHLHTSTPRIGNIQVLRPNSVIVQIPYKAILEYKDQEPHINTLISVLENKKENTYFDLHFSGTFIPPLKRYLWFANKHEKLLQLLTNVECAQLLNISIHTLYRAKQIWQKT